MNIKGRLSIGDVAKAVGAKIVTIRYYEKIKLLPAPPRTESGRRVYGPTEARKLAFIRRARELGFTLDEIRISKGVRYDKDFTPQKRFEPDADTLALYHSNEGQGDVLKDFSGNAHHGKIFGAKWVRVGPSMGQISSSFLPSSGMWR